MIKLLSSLILVGLVLWAGCGKGDENTNRPNRTQNITGKTLSETLEEHRQHLLSIPGVQKVEAGNCLSDSCIKVYVDKKTPILTNQIPPMLETWQVEVVESAQ